MTALETTAFAEWLVTMNLDSETSDVIESYRLAWIMAIDFTKDHDGDT